MCQQKNTVTWKKEKYKEQIFHVKGSAWQEKGHQLPERNKLFSMQSDMNPLGEKKNQVKSTALTMADVL